MIKKFLDWWSNGKVAQDIAIEETYNDGWEEYKFETTLVRDLKKISHMLGSDFPKHLFESIHEYKVLNSITLMSKGYEKEYIKDIIRLKSLKLESSWDSIKSYHWEIDYDEYMKVYKSKSVRLSKAIQELTAFIEANFDNEEYFYTFCKYEDSVHIVKNTLNDEWINNDGEISEEVFQKAKMIITRCAHAINDKKEELELIAKLQKDAVSKSLINRLDQELEFMDTYIEIQ